MDKIILTTPQKRCAKILLECIARKQFTVEYGEISKMTGIPAHAPGRDVGAQVGEVSKRCYQLGLPLISVMVVLKGTQMCSDGFFGLCNELNIHPEYKNHMGMMMEICMNEVKSCDQWDRLADDIGVEIDGISKPKDTLLETIQSERIEGNLIQITSTAYERDPALRNECIRKHGTKCKICGFEAAKIYGNEFAGKIHVHHITPLGSIKEFHTVNPDTDLIPVCPNCHMILHSKKDGVYLPEEIIEMINNATKN